MTTPRKPRPLKLPELTLNKETLGNLTADEAEMALGGGKKKKTKLPMTLGPTCDPPATAHCGSGSCNCNTVTQTC